MAGKSGNVEFNTSPADSEQGHRGVGGKKEKPNTRQTKRSERVNLGRSLLKRKTTKDEKKKKKLIRVEEGELLPAL